MRFPLLAATAIMGLLTTDGTFRYLERSGLREITVDGTFSVDAPLLKPAVLTLQGKAWSPEKVCKDLAGTDCRPVTGPQEWRLTAGPWSRDAVDLGGRTFRRDRDPPPAPIFGRWQGRVESLLALGRRRVSLFPDVKLSLQPDGRFAWSGKWPGSGDCRIDASGSYSLEGTELTLRSAEMTPTTTGGAGCAVAELPREAALRITRREDQSLGFLGIARFGSLELHREGSGLLKLAPRD